AVAGGSQGPLLEAADQLTVGPDIDESPGAVFGINGIAVGLAHEANAHFIFGEIFQGGGKARLSAVHLVITDVQANAADILLAAPDHLFFFLAATVDEDVWPHDRESDNDQSHHENHEQESVALLGGLLTPSWAACAHAEGGASRF